MLIDEGDLPLINELKMEYYFHFKSGYVRLEHKKTGKKTLFHRILLGLGEFDGISVTDHINGIRNDNRRGNLRVLTKGQNNQHRTKTRNGKYRNVYRHSKDANGMWKYVVQFQFDGKNYYGGYFGNIDDAAKRADEMRKEVFGFLS